MNPVFQTFSTLKGYYVYDRGTNSIINLKKEEFDLLNNKDEDTILHIRSKGYLGENTIKKIKHKSTDNLQYHLDNNMERFTIQLTQNCNLRCSYCPYTGGYENRNHANRTIDIVTIKKGIDYILAHSQNTKQISIGFYGGEPLLEMPLLKKAMAYMQEIKEGRDIYCTITTNGTLLTDENVEYFIENDIHIIVSLDGAKEYHNANRVFHNGKGSFDTIMEKLTHIKQKYPKFFSELQINSVIDTNNDLSCTNDFFNADEVLEQLTVTMNTVSEYNVKGAVRYQENFKLVNDYEMCKTYLYMIGKISHKHVSKLYEQNKGRAHIIYKTLRPHKMSGEEMHPSGPCLPGVSRLLMDVDGNFYPCERVSEKSEIMRIGNVEDGIDAEKAKYLLNVGKITEKECIDCFASNFCKACCACSDGDTELSREKKMVYCSNIKYTALQEMKLITMLKEFGYNFEELVY